MNAEATPIGSASASQSVPATQAPEKNGTLTNARGSS
jgi:hypothetical protein